MRDPVETLEELRLVFLELNERDEDTVILVEGMKDRAALGILGIGGEIRQVQGRKQLFNIAEDLAQEGKKAIILTDWDRTGGQLARHLRDALAANCVQYDDQLRRRLSKVSKSEIKDIESLPAFFSRLVAAVQPRRG